MTKIFKLIISVILATLAGIWATKYHGYIMLVLTDKTIKISIAAFAFMLVALLFLIVFSLRIVKLTYRLLCMLSSYFIGLFSVNKQQKFTDLIADISLENQRLIKKLSIANISKFTPRYLTDYILFRKLNTIAASKNIKDLSKALDQLNNQSFTYAFFEVYKLYLSKNFTQAHAKILTLLERNNARFLPNVVNLAADIALGIGNANLALKVLERYNAYLDTDSEEKLIILALRKAKDINKLTTIYNSFDATNILSEIYLKQLVKFGEMPIAKKFAKKQLNNLNISAEMLKLYIDILNMPINRLFEKVLINQKKDYKNMLTLLDLALIKADKHSFKIIYNYIETNVKNSLSKLAAEKYSYILCKFLIKNGEVAGFDLSKTRLIYADS